MRVCAFDEAGNRCLLGWATVREDAGPVLRVPAFGAQEVSWQTYRIGTLGVFDAATAMVVRGILLEPGQSPHLLPGWLPADG
jgi:hypothetical protein